MRAFPVFPCSLFHLISILAACSSCFNNRFLSMFGLLHICALFVFEVIGCRLLFGPDVRTNMIKQAMDFTSSM